MSISVRLKLQNPRLQVFPLLCVLSWNLFFGLASSAVFAQDGRGKFIFKRVVPPGITESLYLYEKKRIDNGIYRFRTRIKYDDGHAFPPGAWRTANCRDSTIDGVVVSARPTATVEEGVSQLLNAICD